MFRSCMTFASLLACLGAAQSAPAFTCQAQGSAWSIKGSAPRKMSCQFTCAMTGQGDMADHATCTAAVGPGASEMPCEGFLSERRWTAAELVAETCAQLP